MPLNWYTVHPSAPLGPPGGRQREKDGMSGLFLAFDFIKRKELSEIYQTNE